MGAYAPHGRSLFSYVWQVYHYMQVAWGVFHVKHPPCCVSHSTHAGEHVIRASCRIARLIALLYL